MPRPRNPGDELMPCPRCGNMVKLSKVEPGEHKKLDDDGNAVDCD